MPQPFLKLAGKLILAPMHDITNIALRIMCKEYGASLISTELLSANAVAIKNKAVMKLAQTDKSEKPACAQLFSQNTENMVAAAKILEKQFDIIDINFGCPSTKIMKQGSGGALLKRKNKIAEIVRAVSESVNVPVSVKIRSGYDERSINSVEIAKICEKNGASAVIIHPRTVVQGYYGKADWNLIKQIKENIKIPVIGNGDVFSGQDAARMLAETGCDYVMIGRGAIGNPFIFKEINEFFKTGKVIKQTNEEKIRDYFEYVKLTKKFGIFSVADARKRAQEFTKGIEGCKGIRRKLNKAKSWEEVEEIMKN